MMQSGARCRRNLDLGFFFFFYDHTIPEFHISIESAVFI